MATAPLFSHHNAALQPVHILAWGFHSWRSQLGFRDSPQEAGAGRVARHGQDTSLEMHLLLL